MINNRSKLVEVCAKKETMNALNESVGNGYEVLFTTDMTISLSNGSTQQVMNVLAAHSTHTGITRDGRITTAHLIKDGNTFYAIDYVNNDYHHNIQVCNLRLVESL